MLNLEITVMRWLLDASPRSRAGHLLSTGHALALLTFTMTVCAGYSVWAHFTDKDTEAQKTLAQDLSPGGQSSCNLKLFLLLLFQNSHQAGLFPGPAHFIHQSVDKWHIGCLVKARHLVGTRAIPVEKIPTEVTSWSSQKPRLEIQK